MWKTVSISVDKVGPPSQTLPLVDGKAGPLSRDPPEGGLDEGSQAARTRHRRRGYRGGCDERDRRSAEGAAEEEGGHARLVAQRDARRGTHALEQRCEGVPQAPSEREGQVGADPERGAAEDEDPDRAPVEQPA